MSSLIPFGSATGLSPRAERQLNQQIANVQARGLLTAVDGRARIQAVQEVTEEGLMSAAEVVAMANLLVQRTPQAEAAIGHIASAGLMAMGDIVMRTGKRCCR